jgi:hypothetical protein
MDALSQEQRTARFTREHLVANLRSSEKADKRTDVAPLPIELAMLSFTPSTVNPYDITLTISSNSSPST